MNQTQVAASPWGRDYVERFGDIRGVLKRPVLSMHTITDGLAPVAHESAYRELVEKRGNSQYLVQDYTTGVGHCAFTGEQILAALAAMNHWLDTGVKPDATFFPEAIGFNNSFVPPPWPY